MNRLDGYIGLTVDFLRGKRQELIDQRGGLYTAWQQVSGQVKLLDDLIKQAEENKKQEEETNVPK